MTDTETIAELTRANAVLRDIVEKERKRSVTAERERDEALARLKTYEATAKAEVAP